jgi:hypothetical protein
MHYARSYPSGIVDGVTGCSEITPRFATTRAALLAVSRVVQRFNEVLRESNTSYNKHAVSRKINFSVDIVTLEDYLFG